MILSLEEYIQLMEEIDDARLLKTALERMGKFDQDSLISQEEIDKKFGFTPEMLEEDAEIEFE